MHLRHIVPALGILASTTGAAFAENVGGLTVGGFVDTIFTATDTKNETGTSADPGAGGVEYEFTAATELRLGFKATEKVTAQVDLEWNNGDGTGRSEYLEQAYVNYAFADQFSVTTGKFTTFAGWVSADADGLFRVTAGPIVNLYGGELVGAALNYAPNEQLGISFFLVNGLDIESPGWNPNGVTGLGADASSGNDNKYISPAVDIVYKAADLGTFNFEAGYDYLGNDAAGEGQSLIHIGANATIKPKAYEALTLGAELIWQQASVGDLEDTHIGALGLINHVIPNTPFPMSGTASLQYVSATGDNGSVDATSTIMEGALALLTNPTGDSHFGLNAELSYLVESPETGEDITDIGFALEAIAVIP